MGLRVLRFPPPENWFYRHRFTALIWPWLLLRRYTPINQTMEVWPPKGVNMQPPDRVRVMGRLGPTCKHRPGSSAPLMDRSKMIRLGSIAWNVHMESRSNHQTLPVSDWYFKRSPKNIGISVCLKHHCGQVQNTTLSFKIHPATEGKRLYIGVCEQVHRCMWGGI